MCYTITIECNRMVNGMMKQADLNKVRQAVRNHVGSRVSIIANKGRHKVDKMEGIISEIYPSIFLVEVKNETEGFFKTFSFSYTDVLTRDVRLKLCEKKINPIKTAI